MSSQPSPSSSSAIPPNLQPQSTVSSPQLENKNKPNTNNPRISSLQSKLSTLQSHRSSLIASSSSSSSSSSFPSSPSSSTAFTTPSTSFSSSTLSYPSSLPKTREEEEQTIASANRLIKEQIRLLQRYNEIKDIGQGLMGMIAEREGRRVGEVMGEYGVGDGD